MQHHPGPRRTRHDFVEPGSRDEPVLVVVFLRGGADALTLAPPVAADAYRRARPTLAVEAADAIDIDGYFALNTALTPLVPALDDGTLMLVHGAGSEDDSRSHFEAQDTMEHGSVDAGSGWLARFLRAGGVAHGALSAVAIGTTRPESLRGAPAGAVIQTVHDFSFGDDDPALVDQLARLYAVEQGGLGGAARDTIEAVRRLRALRASAAPPDGGAVYPDTPFGRGLREIAKLVKAQVGLVATTIDLNGWDTHFVQLGIIGSLMEQLGAGLGAFRRDLCDHRQRVTVVVMTEFGRRLRENTSFGTDHGAGSLMLVLGDAVREVGGGRPVVSGWTDLDATQLDEVGDVPASIDYRDVLAPILARHAPGLDAARVFPGHVPRPIGDAPRRAVGPS
jgi:uncharacterized protein (DUF1501 family)